MAIVSQAWLTMAIMGVSFFRGSIIIARAVSLGLLMYSGEECGAFYHLLQRESSALSG